MSARLEKVAYIKARILRAVTELEHGDSNAAVMALSEALSAMLQYVLEQEEAIETTLAAVKPKALRK